MIEVVNIEGTSNAAVFAQFTQKKDHVNKVTDTSIGKKNYKYVQWGAKNNEPQIRENLVMNNNIAPTLIQTKRDLALGDGLICYKKVFENGKYTKTPVQTPTQIAEFLEASNIEDYLDSAAGELIIHANVFTEFVMTKGMKVYSLSMIRSRHVRATKKKNGTIPFYLIKDNWKTSTMGEEDESMVVQGWDDSWMVARKYPKKFIYHTGDKLLGDAYYCRPSWWGSRDWIELANAIPEFHKAQLKHGYTLRYLIEYPEGYFDGEGRPSGSKELKAWESARQQRKQDFMDTVNNVFAGAENAGKAMHAAYKIINDKMFPGCKITPITTQLHDEALIKLFDKSNDANISSHGVPPSLAMIQTQGKLSSGSDIRNALLMYLAVKAPNNRRRLFEALNLVKKINGWPKDIHFGFQDTQITTLDQNIQGQNKVLS